jgi:hypothetical protein
MLLAALGHGDQPGLSARMSTPWVPYSAALEAEGASEKVS